MHVKFECHPEPVSLTLVLPVHPPLPEDSSQDLWDKEWGPGLGEVGGGPR